MANTLDDVTFALQNYIVAPLNAFGMGGFVFDMPGENISQSVADITDHFTEDNKALQDDIAIRPRRITLRGYVGEVVYGNKTNPTSLLAAVTQKLTPISAFLPRLTAGARQIQETVKSPTNASATLASAADIYSVVKNSIGAFGVTSRQQAAYQYFQACQSQAVLMGIQTPWEFLANMAIESIVAIESEESIFITDFSITFKQIRIASTLVAPSPLTGTGGIPPTGGPSEQGAAALQGETSTNNGSTPGVGLPSKTLPGAQGLMTGVTDLVKVPLSYVFNYGE